MEVERALGGQIPDEFLAWVRQQCEAPSCRSVLEVGGGARPLLSLVECDAMGLDRYCVLDISAAELRKAPTGYETICGDIAGEVPAIDGPAFDLVISRMVAEHVPDPAAMHRNCRKFLRYGGVALHCFPLRFYPPFALNALIPEAWSSALVARLQPSRVPESTIAKFPAMYRWCEPPTRRQATRLRQAGFETEKVKLYFGTQYLSGVPVVGEAERALSRFLCRREVDVLSSFATYKLVAV